MKDLYKRTGMRTYAPDFDVFDRNAKLVDVHAAKYVLGHGGRRQVYDRTHATLTDIAAVRRTLKLEQSVQWAQMEDFKSPNARNGEGLSNGATFFLVILAFIGIIALDAVLSEKTPRQGASTSSPRSSDPVDLNGSLSPMQKRSITPDQVRRSGMRGYVTANTLNVREAPDTSAPVIGKLSKYDDVRALEVGDTAPGWSLVTFDNRRWGYVSSGFINGGNGANARNADCRLLLVRPESGTILGKSLGGFGPLAGSHSSDDAQAQNLHR